MTRGHILRASFATVGVFVVGLTTVGPDVLGGVLYGILQIMLLLNWPVAVIMCVAAYGRPRILALTVMAVVSTLIAIGLSTYVFAVGNAAVGYLVPQDIARVLFRATLAGLGLFPLWFLWLFFTGRFKD